MQFEQILVASHNTNGARAAEKLAHTLCAPGAMLHHLYVIPDFWKGMLGDDWLNNAVTQDRFGKYVESQLEKEIEQAQRRMQSETEAGGLQFRFQFRVGRPAEQLTAAAKRLAPGLVVIGSPRPKGMTGLRSRMELEVLARELALPLLIAPHPGQ